MRMQRFLLLGSALALGGLAVGECAEPAPHPLVGATSDQVRRQLGEPRSQLGAQDRQLWIYPNERLTLRGGVVVEVQVAGAVPAAGGSTAEKATPRPTPPPAPAASAPAAPAAVPPAGVAEPAAAKASPPPPAERSSTPPVAPSPAPLPAKVEIKAVRPPGAGFSVPVRPAAPTPAPVPAVPAADPVARPSSVPAAPEVTPGLPAPGAPEEQIFRERAAAEQAKADKVAAEAQVREMKQRALAAARRRMEEARIQQAEEGIIPLRLVLGVAVVTLLGVVFLGWRWWQRRLQLAATAVANTPVPAGGTSPAAPADVDPTFSEEFVAGLTPHQFEHLVAEYFNRTGVVAQHLKPGRGAVAQIRISWKGDPKPFAGVFCIAAPVGPIEAKALMPLLAELEHEEISRGHIVTTGTFSAGARHLAEERSLTLLGGEAFLEKLRSLPESARREIRRTLQAGQRHA